VGHLLEVRNLKTHFNTDRGIVKAHDGVSYYIDESEIVGLVGESGCGKSVTQLSVTQLISSPPGKIVEGVALFEGRDLLKLKPRGDEMSAIRGHKIGMIFQEPMTSLNPVLTVGYQINEMLEIHLKMSKQSAREQSIELLKLVGIPDARNRIDSFPHQFSGGMRQRVMIAIALSCNPKLVIADEPTTAVDVTTQAQLFELMVRMVEHFNTSLVVVTHNLGVVARYSHRIYVMYAGRIVETGTSEDIFASPLHPYTVGLLKSVPRLDSPKEKKLIPIAGLPPDLSNMPSTCAFLPRCPYHGGRCRLEPWPDLRFVNHNHAIACYVDIAGKMK
jgi:oligopeptide/dipeptide ABC transporter ATP-binding protein